MEKLWMLGPFIRPLKGNPVIKPNSNTVFDCPMRKEPVNWEKLHTFNPAAVVKDNQINVLYRAEDDTGKMKVGGHTSRLGLATSDDGISFKKNSHPVLYPDEDDQKKAEWDGGCEDPRVIKTEDNLYIVLYTQYNRLIPKLAVAQSSDLIQWKKYGSAFKGSWKWKRMPTKSGSIVCSIIDGELKAAKIHGKYWMYFGERALYLAKSSDLISWRVVKKVFSPRKGYYDSMLTEAGPPALLTKDGIILLYNGKNHPHHGDPAYPINTYTVGQILFDKEDPSQVLDVSKKPCFIPEADFEKTGQYKDGTTFAEGLVLFKDKLFLYYGCADSFVGVAIAKNRN